MQPQVKLGQRAGSSTSSGPIRRMFFSHSGGLHVRMSLGDFKAQEGPGGTIIQKRMGEKTIAFTPFNTTQHGGMKGGYLSTSNPEEIAFLEQRMQEVGDVFDETTWHMQVKGDMAPSETARVIVEQNRMIEELTRQNSELQRQQQGGTGPVTSVNVR